MVEFGLTEIILSMNSKIVLRRVYLEISPKVSVRRNVTNTMMTGIINKNSVASNCFIFILEIFIIILDAPIIKLTAFVLLLC